MLTEAAARHCSLCIVSGEGMPAVDDAVKRALERWPGVPAVYGWLVLDRRGEWRLRNPASGAFERIGNAALRAFIARNYARDAQGAWYFQNGPQRVHQRVFCLRDDIPTQQARQHRPDPAADLDDF